MAARKFLRFLDFSYIFFFLRKSKLETGDYVILLKPSTYYPDVLRGDLGKVVDDYWRERDGTLHVDVLSGLDYTNLNLSSRDLKRIKEEDIQRGKLPQEANRERVPGQHEALRHRVLYKNYQ